MEQSIEIRDTGITVVDVLGSIAQGYSYYQILLTYKQLTLADIMLCARVAQELISGLVVSKGQISVSGKIEITASQGRIVSLTEVRKQFPRAFETWSPDEDQRLLDAFSAGVGVSELMKRHGRQRGAIRTRLRRLGALNRDS